MIYLIGTIIALIALLAVCVKALIERDHCIEILQTHCKDLSNEMYPPTLANIAISIVRAEYSDLIEVGPDRFSSNLFEWANRDVIKRQYEQALNRHPEVQLSEDEQAILALWKLKQQ